MDALAQAQLDTAQAAYKDKIVFAVTDFVCAFVLVVVPTVASIARDYWQWSWVTVLFVMAAFQITLGFVNIRRARYWTRMIFELTQGNQAR